LAGTIVLLVSEVVCQLGAERALHQFLRQPLQQAVLADQILRPLVACQKVSDQAVLFVVVHSFLSV
jgi:hypothetical protein